jgi:hypothetical protein
MICLGNAPQNTVRTPEKIATHRSPIQETTLQEKPLFFQRACIQEQV